MINCIMFDLDGTLFYTKKANALAYIKALKEEGFDVSEEDYNGVFGLRSDEFLPKIAKGITRQQIKRVRERKVYFYGTNLDMIKPNKTLLDFLKSLSKQYQTALVTTASKKSVDMILEHFNLTDEFDVIIYGEDAKISKPDPESYLLAMKKCNIKPQDCLVFEDSEVGVKAALASGANVIRVPNS